MYSYQMIGVADQNNRVYTSKYGTYSKENGFILSGLSKSMTKEELLDNVMHEDCWSLRVEEKEMTKEEIEKALGYKIKIKDDKNIKKYEQNESSGYKRDTHGLFGDDDIWSLLFK